MAATHHSIDMYPVHRVPLTRAFIWLREGYQDMRHHPAASLGYGWLVATLGALILAYSRHPLYIAASIVGFLLVGPIITAGLCELSRRRDHGEATNFQLSLQGLSRNSHNLIHFAGVLAVLALAWFGLVAMVMYLTSGSIAPNIESTVWGDVMARLSGEQLRAYAVAFVAVAIVVFSLSVVTVPMIIDRHVDAGTAMRISLRATARDFPALLVWAVVIVGLVLLGFATWLVGMVVILPLLGHATWHAYRDIVEEA